MQNLGETHMFYLAKEVRKIWRCSCWEKDNFIMINEFKHGQTWTIWPFPLSLSLYSIFKHYFIFFIVNEHLEVPFVDLSKSGSCVEHFHFFCLHRISFWAFLKLYKLNLTHCLKSSLLLAFCFLFVCMVDQTQMYPLSQH